MQNTETNSECRGDFFVRNGELIENQHFNDRIHVTGISFYEVLRVKEKTPLFAEDHLKRLLKSVKNSGSEFSLPLLPVSENIRLLIFKNHDIEEGNIRVLLHFPVSLNKQPDIYIYYIPHYYPSEEEYTAGVRLIPVHTERTSIHSKIINPDFRSFINQKIKANSAYEAILVNNQGYITEGSKSNVFFIKNNKIVTPPEKDVLPGITRKYVLDICRNSGNEVEEKKINYAKTGDYDSCFITGTSPGVLAARNIGSTGFSPVHPLIKFVRCKYESLVNKYIESNRPSG